jgi:hypothetical protein
MHDQLKIYCFVAYTPLNMFWALLCPLSGAPPTAFAATAYRMIAGLDMLQAVVGLLVVNRPQLEERPTRQSYGNQRLQRQLEGLLMMGTTVPETC